MVNLHRRIKMGGRGRKLRARGAEEMERRGRRKREGGEGGDKEPGA